MVRIAPVTSFHQRDTLHQRHDGFSLLELVVAVSIMLIIAVIGFIAYQGFTDNARQAAVERAASDVFTAAMAESATEQSANLTAALQSVAE